MIDTNANSFLKLLGTERLCSFPKLPSSQTNSLQHQTSSWRTSPERQLGFSCQQRTSVKLTETVLSFGEAHCFKAAQQGKMYKQEKVTAVAFSPLPAPWSPQSLPGQGFPNWETHASTDRQTDTALHSHCQTREYQPRGTAVTPL